MNDRFLIVDDSRAVRTLLKKILLDRGVREEGLKLVSRGDQALTAFETFQPGLTFLDIDMPGMYGDEVAQAILATDPSALVVGVTGLEPTDDRVRNMMSCGVFDVIHKPVRKRKVDDLFNLVREERSGLDRVM